MIVATWRNASERSGSSGTSSRPRETRRCRQQGRQQVSQQVRRASPVKTCNVGINSKSGIRPKWGIKAERDLNFADRAASCRPGPGNMVYLVGRSNSRKSLCCTGFLMISENRGSSQFRLFAYMTASNSGFLLIFDPTIPGFISNSNQKSEFRSRVQKRTQPTDWEFPQAPFRLVLADLASIAAFQFVANLGWRLARQACRA